MKAFIDSNIPMYVAGGEHPHREPARRFLARVQKGEIEDYTSTEVVSLAYFWNLVLIGCTRPSPFSPASCCGCHHEPPSGPGVLAPAAGPPFIQGLPVSAVFSHHSGKFARGKGAALYRVAGRGLNLW